MAKVNWMWTEHPTIAGSANDGKQADFPKDEGGPGDVDLDKVCSNGIIAGSRFVAIPEQSVSRVVGSSDASVRPEPVFFHVLTPLLFPSDPFPSLGPLAFPSGSTF